MKFTNNDWRQNNAFLYTAVLCKYPVNFAAKVWTQGSTSSYYVPLSTINVIIKHSNSDLSVSSFNPFAVIVHAKYLKNPVPTSTSMSSCQRVYMQWWHMEHYMFMTCWHVMVNVPCNGRRAPKNIFVIAQKIWKFDRGISFLWNDIFWNF